MDISLPFSGTTSWLQLVKTDRKDYTFRQIEHPELNTTYTSRGLALLGLGVQAIALLCQNSFQQANEAC